MATGPTYLQFHAAFILPALAFLTAAAAVTRVRARRRTVWSVGDRRYWVGVAVVTVVAVVYTTPWDSYMIATGVWGYGADRTIATVAGVPVGEYLFFAFQPLLTAMWLGQIGLRTGWPTLDPFLRGDDGRRRLARDAIAVRPRLLAGAAALGIGLVGWWLLGPQSTFYLGAILLWSAPVLALQWTFGAPQLWYQRTVLAIGISVPTLYLCVVDRIAIATGIWHISPAHTTGVTLAGLPLEEAVFFAVTNTFLVQGLVLYQWVMHRWE